MAGKNKFASRNCDKNGIKIRGKPDASAQPFWDMLPALLALGPEWFGRCLAMDSLLYRLPEGGTP
jgi:hypothetical protein